MGLLSSVDLSALTILQFIGSSPDHIIYTFFDYDI